MSVQSEDIAAVWRDSALSAIGPHELLLVSDFDGTLAEIVPEPTLARPLPDSLSALRRLAPVLRKVVILSSRTNPELAGLLSVPGALLVGDSGLPPPTAEELQALRVFNAEAAKLLGTVPGAWIEIKPASSAVHFRNAPISGQELLDLLRPLLKQTGLYGGLGRKVIEVHSPKAGKGTTLEALLRRYTPAGVVSMGDDENDRSVFDVASKTSIPHLCVGVGSAEVPRDLFDHCDLIVEGPAEASAFLRSIADWAVAQQPGALA
ncbi:MAG: trehalose-phosphatase [Candidatus Dormibacteraeota bacterium]|nr:trehalose-phosphatase [Candidatus Dormibacteraeota bacterium]